ncbi:heat shock protein GrpE [Roseovarius sp. THAF9]|uniref:nucleotide exchange factor GrpE n=1 Tax=Roseovarius sp. THAF9 TaxID=2587847 RepID=UPI0012678D13|nr:nucleotide exchange factor GrpE [Roseovarius sp. THAF9]QFT94987.1 heat shock protein GrpE [Roseovarius sp. THAF9]
MAQSKEGPFLDDVEQAEEEEHAATTEEDAPESPEHQIESLRAERDAFQDKFMRALADAENARKRAQRERTEAENYGGSKLARDILPVYDNLKRAVETVTDEQRKEAAALIEGVELTMRELVNVFSKHGIQVIDPQVGDKFDPKQHEAMFEAPVPGTKAGEIIQVSAQGFILYDRILRPAQVGVSSFTG